MSVNVGETIIRFGKHKGLPIREVPLQYLEWCIENNVGGPDGFTAIAAFLGRFVAPQSAASSNSTHKKPNVPPKPKRDQLNCAKLNCSHLFNADCDWSDKQNWDGITAPWFDQSGALDDEFNGLFR